MPGRSGAAAGSPSEELALRFGRTKHFDSISRRTFDSLDQTLGARADLGEVVSILVTKVLSSWPQAAELLAGQDVTRDKLWALIQHRAARLLR